MTKPDQKAITAVYMRGGTSRALVFHRGDLPALENPNDATPWDPIFLAALGSPDPAGRQLDGMGGGISSLSKIAVVGPSARPDADVDYTFGQVSVGNAYVGYRGNCGNISSAIGPFAADEGLIETRGDTATVRIHNTNTGKIIRAEFPLAGGKAAVKGDFRIQGIAGSGAPIRLSFLDPGGAVTGRLFPTGELRQKLHVPGLGSLTVSLVDAANPVVFVDASSMGLAGNEKPEHLAQNDTLMRALQDLRICASLEMGIASSVEEAQTKSANLPLVALITSSSRDGVPATHADISLRMISAGMPHKATPLTGAMCVAVAAKIGGTLVNELIDQRAEAGGADLCIAHPSGTLQVAAEVSGDGISATAVSVTVYRTARRLMEGRVLIPT